MISHRVNCDVCDDGYMGWTDSLDTTVTDVLVKDGWGFLHASVGFERHICPKCTAMMLEFGLERKEMCIPLFEALLLNPAQRGIIPPHDEEED